MYGLESEPIHYAQSTEVKGLTKHSVLSQEPEKFFHAVQLYNSQQYADAKYVFIELLQNQPDHQPTIEWLAKCFRAQGEMSSYDKLIVAWEVAMPGVNSHLHMALRNFELAKFKASLVSAFAALDYIQSECVELFEIYKCIGNCYVSINDLDAAEEYYNKAFAMNPNCDVLLTNYGTLEIQKGEIGRATIRFRQAVTINQKNDRAWVGLALTHRELGDYELAWANIERALDANPLNGCAVDIYVEWCVKESKLNLALRRLSHFVRHHDEDIIRSFCLAKIHYLSGQLLEAFCELEKVLTYEPGIEGGLEFREIITKEMFPQGAVSAGS